MALRRAPPRLIDGQINGERFQLYVDEVLVPTLKPATSSSSHQGKSHAGAKLFLLPIYSPACTPSRSSSQTSSIGYAMLQGEQSIRLRRRRPNPGTVTSIECRKYRIDAGMPQPKFVPL